MEALPWTNELWSHVTKACISLCKNKWGFFLCSSTSVYHIWCAPWICVDQCLYVNKSLNLYKQSVSLKSKSLIHMMYFYSVSLLHFKWIGKKNEERTVLWRCMDVLRVWKDMRLSNWWQNFHFWVTLRSSIRRTNIGRLGHHSGNTG